MKDAIRRLFTSALIHSKYPQVPAMGWPYVYLLLSILGGHTTASDRAHLKAKDY